MIAVTWIIVLTSAENQDQESPKYAVSYQSFHRDDVPLSYKYSAVHVMYTTAKPDHIHRKQLSNEKQQKIDYALQYAPIYPTRTQNTNIENNNLPVNPYILIHPESYKRPLEPNRSSEMNLNAVNKYIAAGYNNEMVQDNPISGHNTVYKDSIQNVQHKKV